MIDFGGNQLGFLEAVGVRVEAVDQAMQMLGSLTMSGVVSGEADNVGVFLGTVAAKTLPREGGT